MRSSELLSSNLSRLLVVDMQTKLLAAMPNADSVIANIVKLIRSSKLFEIPVDATEQYPQGLGATVDEIAQYIPNRAEKLRFSSSTAVSWGESGPDATSPHQAILVGIETHVCVLQTAFDLQASGFEVYVVADAVTSRNQIDYDFALKRMADNGIHIVTTEMVLFEWCETAAADQFKQISRIVTNRD